MGRALLSNITSLHVTQLTLEQVQKTRLLPLSYPLAMTAFVPHRAYQAELGVRLEAAMLPVVGTMAPVPDGDYDRAGCAGFPVSRSAGALC